MARIKGLTIEIGGDTTNLGKALDGVNKNSRQLSSELTRINKLLKVDPENTDLLAQKQQVLSEAVENTSKKLDTLRKAEAQVQEQFKRGEVSEAQMRDLQREIIATEQRLNGYKNAVKDTEDALDGLSKASERAENIEKIGTAAGKGMKLLMGAVTAAGGALAAAAEGTREYRTEMGKLDAAYAASGHAADTARASYTHLQSIIGETDQSVEAAQQIALLADSAEDVSHWAGLAAGVMGTFGDALQPETFYESANETMKLGEATGAFTQMLEGTGKSVEDFNAGLAACTTEAEKQAYMLKVAEESLGAAGKAYEENNGDIIAANAANEQWMQSLAQIGSTIEPVVTSVKSLGAELLGKLVPVIEWCLGNVPTLAVVFGGLTAAVAAFKVASIAATAATQGMTLAQYAAAAAQKALNLVMAANPIGLVIIAITALAAAFTYLWQHSEAFREFWIATWDNIKDAAHRVVEWFKEVPDKVYNAMIGAVEKVKSWGAQVIEKAREATTNAVETVRSKMAEVPDKVHGAINGAIGKVRQWGTDMASKAREGMTDVATAVKTKLGELPGQIRSIGSDLITGLWNGISDKIGWIKSQIGGLGRTIMSKIKGVFGVHSPSRETAWVGEMLDAGLAKGIEDAADQPMHAMSQMSTGVLDAAAEDLNGLTFHGRLHTVEPVGAPSIMDSGLLGKLDSILGAIERGQIITLDSDVIVGATANKMDKALGNHRALVARGVV